MRDLIQEFLWAWNQGGGDRFFAVVLAILGVALVGAVVLGIAWVMFQLGHWILFRRAFKTPSEIPGTVASKRYEKGHTTFVPVGKTMAAQYHPPQYFVTIRTELKSFELEDEELYGHLNRREALTILYQERWVTPRFWSGPWTLHGYRLLTITDSEGNRFVINSERPNTRGLPPRPRPE